MHRLNIVQPSMKNRPRSVTVGGSGQVCLDGCADEVLLDRPRCVRKRANAQIEHEKLIKVSNGWWQWAGCVMTDVCMNFY